MSKRLLFIAVVGVLWGMPFAGAQTLARPGWAGSGMTANIWWRHAVVYAVDTHSNGGLKAVAARMDAMQMLNVDAVLLRGVQGAGEAGIDPAAGTMDDFDAVLREASNRSLRVLQVFACVARLDQFCKPLI